MKLIALSVPIFFILIGIELLVGVLTHKKLYRFNDAITNLSCGIGQQVLGVFFAIFVFAAYTFVYIHFRVFTFPETWWSWLILFIGLDFFYYWFHRFGHEINFIWATHIVHHQSEEYNLSVALRQSWFQGFFSWAFYLPLAFAGFSPLWIVTVAALNSLYQFWIHTKLIKNMGFLEYILNTPSHHRVHHGRNPEYIDKNHAGTFIIWDRMFGTFQKELEEPVYGITKPSESWNPLKVNFEYWFDLGEAAGKSKSFKNKVLMFLKSPGWFPAELGGFQAAPPVHKESYHKFDIEVPKIVNYYLLFQFVQLLAFASWYLFFSKALLESGNVQSLIQCIGFAAYILWSITSFGLLFEGKMKGIVVELTRLILSLPLLISFHEEDWFFPVFLIASAIQIFSGILLFLEIYPSFKTNSKQTLNSNNNERKEKLQIF